MFLKEIKWKNADIVFYIYLPTYLAFPILFNTSYGFTLSSGGIFFYPKAIPLLFLIGKICHQWILSVFIWKCLIPVSFLKNSFAGYTIFGSVFFPFQHFEYHFTAFLPLLLLMSHHYIIIVFLDMTWWVVLLLSRFSLSAVWFECI